MSVKDIIEELKSVASQLIDLYQKEEYDMNSVMLLIRRGKWLKTKLQEHEQ